MSTISQYLVLYNTIHEKLANEDYDKYTYSRLRSVITQITEFRHSLSLLSELIPNERHALELLEKKFHVLQLDVEEYVENFLKAQRKICEWSNGMGEIGDYNIFSKWLHNFHRGINSAIHQREIENFGP